MFQVLRGFLVAQEQQVFPDRPDFKVYLALRASLDLLVFLEVPDLGVVPDFQVLRGHSAPWDQQVSLCLHCSHS